MQNFTFKKVDLFIFSLQLGAYLCRLWEADFSIFAENDVLRMKIFLVLVWVI